MYTEKDTKNSAAKQVIENHLKTFIEGDLDGIMSDFATDALLVTPDGEFQGKKEIRSVFEKLLQDLPPGSDMKINKQVIRDNMVYLIWQAESEKVKMPFATDTILVQNGKISKQTFAARIQRK